MSQVDAVTHSVIVNALHSYCAEIAEVLLQTSRNPTLSVGHDFSVAVCDHDARLIAGGAGVPCHLASIDRCVARLLDSDASLAPGDVILTNDPYEGQNTHLADFTIAKPVFDDDGEIVVVVVIRTHQADIGAVDPASMATTAENVYHEGIRIPPATLVDQGERCDGLFETIVANSRVESLQRGDLLAMLGAATTGESLIEDLVDRYSAASIRHSANRLLAETETRSRELIEDLPDGVYHGQSQSDVAPNGPGPVVVRTKMTVDDDHVTVDFSESDEQVEGVTNNSLAVTYSAVNGSWFAVSDLDYPLNSGAFETIDVVAPEGSIVNPTFPAGTAYATITSYQETFEACWRAIGDVVPRETAAGYARMVRPIMSGRDPRTDDSYSQIQLNVMGGGGAVWGSDGPQSVAGTVGFRGGRAVDPEIQERMLPIRIHGTELRTDSGGSGRWRGGLGPRVSISPLDHESTFSVGGDFGQSVPPYGHLGGNAGSPPTVEIVGEDGTVRDVPHAFVNVDIAPEETYVQRSGGGGGVGDPHERDPDRVREDVRDGYVSIEAAREEYGVAIDPETGEIDDETTDILRGNR